MVFPIPEMNANDTANLYSLYSYVNHTATEGLFFPIILLAVWIIAFIGSLAKGSHSSIGFIFATFICCILAVPLVFMNFLGNWYMYGLFLMLGLGVVWIYLERSPGI